MSNDLPNDCLILNLLFAPPWVAGQQGDQLIARSEEGTDIGSRRSRTASSIIL